MEKFKSANAAPTSPMSSIASDSILPSLPPSATPYLHVSRHLAERRGEVRGRGRRGDGRVPPGLARGGAAVARKRVEGEPEGAEHVASSIFRLTRTALPEFRPRGENLVLTEPQSIIFGKLKNTKK